MGRWSYSNRLTTNECKSITTKFLNKHHYFDGGVRWGGMNWSRNGEQTGSIGFVISIIEGDEYIRFQYAQTDRHTQEKTNLDYNVRSAEKITSCFAEPLPADSLNLYHSSRLRITTPERSDDKNIF